MIEDAVASVKTEVMACRSESSQKAATMPGGLPNRRRRGRAPVLVSVRVGPEGNVLDVKVMTTPNPALGSCVAAAVREAEFEPTVRGGTFRYPFLALTPITTDAEPVPPVEAASPVTPPAAQPVPPSTSEGATP